MRRPDSGFNVSGDCLSGTVYSGQKVGNRCRCGRMSNWKIWAQTNTKRSQSFYRLQFLKNHIYSEHLIPIFRHILSEYFARIDQSANRPVDNTRDARAVNSAVNELRGSGRRKLICASLSAGWCWLPSQGRHRRLNRRRTAAENCRRRRRRRSAWNQMTRTCLAAAATKADASSSSSSSTHCPLRLPQPLCLSFSFDVRTSGKTSLPLGVAPAHWWLPAATRRSAHAPDRLHRRLSRARTLQYRVSGKEPTLDLLSFEALDDRQRMMCGYSVKWKSLFTVKMVEQAHTKTKPYCY